MGNDTFCLSTGRVIEQAKNGPPQEIMISSSNSFFDFGFELTISRKRIFEMSENFKSKILGREVPVNYDHPRMRMSRTEAAGWIKELKVVEGEDREAQLMARIEWNDKGKESIKNKHYAYTSIGGYHNFIDPSDGKTEHGMTLFEVSLTNDPANVNLEAITQLSKGVNGMDKDENKRMDEMKALLEKSKLELAKSQMAFDAEKLKLKNEKDLFSRNKKEFEEKERTSHLDKLISEGRLTPAARDKALTLSRDEYAGFLLGIPDKEIISMNSRSINAKDSKKKKMRAEDEIDDMAKKKMENSKMSYAEAVDTVLTENVELSNRYESERI